ncbi:MULTISPECIES: hypothetical protein [Arthrobacter]|uniref:Uncharacterized protein n=1 Tax=Arthrobacter terricola TaxID=2547396 RepID=A0A4R5KL80_9MICC|nr:MULTISPECIES: hypothetical protein [Arthrobacter]MBT8161454.1 hypothetical protein [Arthrobacter sp. GN70]TDF95625.1 hypothetical protein E1809_11400 [Arthrobacter terricola]
MSETARIIYLPTPKVETIDQREYWWEQLEKAERRAEDIRRILGILAIERGAPDEGGDAA